MIPKFEKTTTIVLTIHTFYTFVCHFQIFKSSNTGVPEHAVRGCYRAARLATTLWFNNGERFSGLKSKVNVYQYIFFS